MLLAGGQARWDLIAWLLVGAISMRGAGCASITISSMPTLTANVTHRQPSGGERAREQARGVGLAAGAGALIGLVVLLQLRLPAQIVALASIAPVAAYPFMKRITWWPQAWLGLVFSWGALVGWSELRLDRLEVLVLLYAGSIAWVIGYDTIYALQDREDDALVGIRSSARALGGKVRGGVAGFYGAAIVCWAAAFWLLRPDLIASLALLPMAAHLIWQVATLTLGDNDNALARFRSNRTAGLLMALACWVVGNA